MIFRELARAIQNVIERSLEKHSFRRMFAMLFNDMFTMSEYSDENIRYQSVNDSDIVQASTLKEASAVLLRTQGQEIENRYDGTIARYGSNGRNKLVSDAAREKSLRN